MADDQFDFWHDALAGKDPPIHEGRPQSGFYWSKAGRRGGRVPVAIWTTPTGDKMCRWGSKADAVHLPPEDAARKWTFVSRNPLTREDYVFAYTNNQWPDGTPCREPEATLGDNSSSDPHQVLLELAGEKMESARRILATHDGATAPEAIADRAGAIKNDLGELLKQSNAQHKVEKEPILKAAKEIDDKWRFREDLTDVGKQLLKFITAFTSEKARKEREAAEAERLRREAEARAIAIARQEREKAMRDDPIAALDDIPDEPPAPEPAPPAKPPQRVSVSGGSGRRISLRTTYVAEVTDWSAAAVHYSSHPSVKEVVQRLANADVRLHKNETSVPGVSVKVEEIAA